MSLRDPLLTTVVVGLRLVGDVRSLVLIDVVVRIEFRHMTLGVPLQRRNVQVPLRGHDSSLGVAPALPVPLGHSDDVRGVHTLLGLVDIGPMHDVASHPALDDVWHVATSQRGMQPGDLSQVELLRA
jgi:hypothetical protein